MSKQKLLGSDKVSKEDFWEYYILGKYHRLSFKASTHQSKENFQYLDHADLWGFEKTKTHRGNSYFLFIIDDFSGKVWVYLLKHKSDAFDKFKNYKFLIKNLTDKKVKALRIDNIMEFCNELFDSYYAKEGIQRHRTIRLTPQLNEVAEQMNRIIMNKARCLLLSLGLSKSFWGEAIMTKAYFVNRCPSSAIDFKIPEEKWSGKPLGLSHLKVF